MKALAIKTIKLYQATCRWRRPSCRFYPSCSCYMKVCIERFGLIRGIVLGSLRILRCNPLHPGGVEDVPQNFRLLYGFSGD